MNLQSKNNIILTGFMGAGKTVVGELLAQKIKFDFIDTDKEIEKKINMSVKEIFYVYGEKYFRQLEHKLIMELVKREIKNSVIATGGGLIPNLKNINEIKKLGRIIFLKTSKKVLNKRLKSDTLRPLWANKSLFIKRQQYYNSAAELIIDTDFLTIDEVVERIVLWVNFRRKDESRKKHESINGLQIVCRW